MHISTNTGPFLQEGEYIQTWTRLMTQDGSPSVGEGIYNTHMDVSNDTRRGPSVAEGIYRCDTHMDKNNDPERGPFRRRGDIQWAFPDREGMYSTHMDMSNGTGTFSNTYTDGE